MTGKKRVFGSDFAKVDAHVIAPEEYDEARDLSGLTDEEWARARRPGAKAEVIVAERAYRIDLVPDDNGTLLVKCPALPEVTTFGVDWEDAPSREPARSETRLEVLTFRERTTSRDGATDE